MKITNVFCKLTAIATVVVFSDAWSASGEEVYNTTCAACHAAGVLEAPKPGVAGDWEKRQQRGVESMVKNAIVGFNAMPPKGGNATLSDADVRAAVDYMLAQLKPVKAQADKTTTPDRAQLVSSLDKIIKAKPSPSSSAAPAAAPPRVAEVVRPKAPKKTPAQKKRRPVNTFNRLLKPPSKRNPPPMKDGIHDPNNDGTAILQHPKEAFSTLPKSKSGNRVDWVTALEKGDVQPWFDLEDPNKAPVVLDLNIVREVKGSMPDVVYPHKQHTEWLDCSNCHPSIFIPKKGANNISMAAILLGEKCGVCHGKVAFPVAECRKCHSKSKSKK